MKRKDTTSALILFWWLSAVLPASTARETPHALRTLNVLPVPQIIAAFGIMEIYYHINRKRLFIWLLSISYVLLAISYLHTYHAHYPKTWAASWQYGYKQLVNGVKSEKDNYEKVVVTTAYDQPYIYFLWYVNYDPKFWINDGEFNKRFDKFEFRKIEWGDLSGQEKTLVISSPDETKGKPVKWQIDFPDGKTAFNVTEL